MRHRLFCIGCVLAPLCLAFFPEVYGQSWKSLNDTARTYYSQRAYGDALRYFSAAYTGLGDSARTRSGDRVLRGVANCYMMLGKRDTAITWYQRERLLLADLVGKQDSDYATNAIRIGSCYGFLNDYAQALPYFREARAIRGRIYTRQSSPYAEICFTLANAEYQGGAYAVAEIDYMEAKSAYEALGEQMTPNYASCCNGLTRTLMSRGEYERAEPLALSTLDIRGQLFHYRGPVYALSLFTLAELYTDLGQYEKAEPLRIKTLALQDSAFGKESAEYIGSCIELAKLYDKMQRLADAEPLYAEARRLAKGNEQFRLIYAQASNNLANLELSLGRWREAKADEEEAGAVWAGLPPEDANHAIHYQTLGSAEQGLGDYEAALGHLTKAGELWKVQLGTDHPYYVDNLEELARLHWKMGQYAKARELYVEALTAKTGQAKKIFLFTNEKEKAAYLASTAGVEDEYYSLLWQKGGAADAAYTIALADRNMILSSSRHVRDIVNRSGDAALIDVYRRWVNARRTMDDDSADLLEKQLMRGSEALLPMFRETSVDWKGIRDRLGTGEAAVEFISFQYFDGAVGTDSVLYAALVLRHDLAAPVMVKLCDGGLLNNLLKTAAARFTGGRGAGTMSVQGGDYPLRVYQALWKPLEPELRGIGSVYFAPAGDLYRVSFAALPIGGDSVLSDRYRLEQVSQTDDLARRGDVRLHAGDKISLYGGVDYMAGRAESLEGGGSLGPGTTVWPSLPGTVTETDAIAANGKAKGMQITLLGGTAATEASVKALDGQAWPAVLHLASHGFCFARQDTTIADVAPGAEYRKARDPLMRSGIVLAGGNLGWNRMLKDGEDDGILTSYEISNLYLPAVRLVVLSACETALGEVQGNEGVYGLARAFRMAGVRNLVMSLWTVPDEATAEFMSNFYRHLFDGEDVAAAFRAAQTRMKTKYKKQPSMWAAWILVR